MKKIVSFSQEIPIAMIMCPPTTQTDLTLTDAGINLTMSSQAFGCAINKALASLPSILLSRRYLLTLVYLLCCLLSHTWWYKTDSRHNRTDGNPADDDGEAGDGDSNWLELVRLRRRRLPLPRRVDGASDTQAQLKNCPRSSHTEQLQDPRPAAVRSAAWSAATVHRGSADVAAPQRPRSFCCISSRLPPARQPSLL